MKAYNLAEFFVLATLYESFSLPLVEAMSCGCPALVPETGACPEVGGDAAVYVNPLDPEAIGRAMRKIAESKGAADANAEGRDETGQSLYLGSHRKDNTR